jgi:hypothetical protein
MNRTLYGTRRDMSAVAKQWNIDKTDWMSMERRAQLITQIMNASFVDGDVNDTIVLYLNIWAPSTGVYEHMVAGLIALKLERS